MTEPNNLRFMVDLSQDLKEAGFVYKESDPNDPRFKEVQELLKDKYTIDLRDFEDADDSAR